MISLALFLIGGSNTYIQYTQTLQTNNKRCTIKKATYKNHLYVLMQIMYLVLHCVKGTPFVEVDQGATSRLTHWEQMDEKYSQSKKFLCTVPTVL